MRLDIFLSQKYNFSREYAKSIILKGYVQVDKKVILKPSFKILKECDIALKESFPKYVSRGGFKLEKAIEVFKIDLNNKTCLDIGASTGGFCDCMLKYNARKIYAVDVGKNQLDKSLLNNPKIISIENTDVRDIKSFSEPIHFITADISFISISKVINNIYNFLAEDGEAIFLIKPQFEAGKQNINKGVIKDKKVHKQVLKNVFEICYKANFKILDITFSPIKGKKGNIEYLLYLKKGYFDYKNFDFDKIILKAFEDLN